MKPPPPAPLSPAAIHWQSPQMVGVALLVGVLTVVAVFLLYPSQVRSLRTRWRLLLPGLRCAALLALAASVARPVAQRRLSDDEQGAVVVIVDRSRSMDQRDVQRTPAMLVALADGLGRLPAGARAHGEAFAGVAPDIARLPDLVDRISQAAVELDVARLQGRDNPAARARFDASASEFTRLTQSLAAALTKLKMADAANALKALPPIKSREWPAQVNRVIAALTDRAAQFQTRADDDLYKANPQVRAACDELREMTRFQLVEQALAHPGSGLLSRLPPAAPLFGYAIGPGVSPLPLRGASENVKRLTVAPDGAHSDLTGGLRAVLHELRHQPIQSVLLFSDGRQVGAETAIASSLLGTGVPVYAVCPAPLGRDAAVRDVCVERVTLPPSLFVGETLNVVADVRWSGVPPAKLPEVTLKIGGQEQRQPIRVDKANPSRGTASFALVVSDAGPQQVTVSAGEVEGEISAENNVARRWVKVLGDRFEVLLIGGAPTWDFRYLRTALARTPWVNGRAVLLDKEDARLGLPADQVLAADVVILADAPAKALSPEQWEALRKMVAQRGGSLILLAGQAHLPREYTGEFLSEFLPYRRAAAARAGAVWRTWPGEEPEFRVGPPPGAPQGDLLPLDDDPQASADRYAALPPVFRYLALPELKEIAQPLLAERSSGAPVLTRHRVGRGKVFFLGVDETWRWRARVGERDQDRFFLQLVRAAADEPYAVTDGLASLDADRITIAPGESVRVRARLFETALGAPPADALDVDVVRGGDAAVVKTQRLAPVGGADSGRFEGAVADLPAGEYALRLRGPEGSELEYPLNVAPSFEAELANLTPDDDLLRRLATASGGELRTLEQLADLPARLSSLRESQPRTAEFRLWSSWYLYAFVLACLGVEWSLRKRLGLS